MGTHFVTVIDHMSRKTKIGMSNLSFMTKGFNKFKSTKEGVREVYQYIK